MDSNDKMIITEDKDDVNKEADIKKKGKPKGVAPLVLPDTLNFYSSQFQTRLKYFTASSNAFKWDQTNINSKTKRFLARNGFNSLFWSAIIVDQSIIELVFELFADNIQLISDDAFESTFGISLNKSADISSAQLFANYLLLFTLPAKSHTQYLQEWTKRRLNAFYGTTSRMTGRYRFENQDFDSHPELFLATKRRFYAYKHLVPALTNYAIDSFDKEVDIFKKELFRQIKIAISYSGLQVFYMSWSFSHFSDYYYVFDLKTIEEDIKRITSARNALIEKYGENMLPFARLLNYPEVEGLDRRHYPDLAFCAYRYNVKSCASLPKNTWTNFTFRKIATKTPIDELKRLMSKLKPIDITPRALTEEEEELLRDVCMAACRVNSLR